MGCPSQRRDEAPGPSRLLALGHGQVAVGWAAPAVLGGGTRQPHCRGPGTWLQVLETIGVLAVIANGMVIAFTSEFIPRLVYKYHYGPCRQDASPTVEYGCRTAPGGLRVSKDRRKPGPTTAQQGAPTEGRRLPGMAPCPALQTLGWSPECSLGPQCWGRDRTSCVLSRP